MQATVKSIISPDLDTGSLPDDPTNCAVFIEAEIGPSDQDGAHIFSFTAITPKAMADIAGSRWGRGYLIMDEFTWAEVDRMLARLISHTQGSDWDEITKKLSQQLHWEFENYQNQIQA